MVFELVKHNSIANQYLSELRDHEIQLDRLRFRKNLERIGSLLAYELSKTFHYEQVEIHTPLGEKVVPLTDSQPVLVPILRAGLPFYQGVLNMFDHADSGFVGAWREEGDSGDPEVKLNYVAAPDLEGRRLVLIDPMLATGKSLVLATEHLLKKGAPAHIHVVSLVAAREGLEHVQNALPHDTSYWIGSIDEELDANAYIVPGLGDAGDLSFGPKR